MKRDKIRVVELSGTAYEMGQQHGTAYPQEIRRYAHERVELVAAGQWTGHKLTTDQVLTLAEECIPAHEAYSPDLMAETRGLADATGLTLGEAIIASGFTDFIDTVHNVYNQRQATTLTAQPIDDCTAFIVADEIADGAGFFGQTWDMHDTATEFVILLNCKQTYMPEALMFTTVGCVGQIGMNSAGIAVGINNLMGADGQVGVTWPFVVRKVLQQDNIDDALACITDADLAGAHNFLLFDKTGRGYNIEAMPTHQHITELGSGLSNGIVRQSGSIVHTNHCLVPETIAVAQERPPESQTSSETRLTRGYELLEQHPVTIDKLIDLTRDPQAICVQSKPPFHVESCGAAIMRPKTGDFWAVWGLPSENEYEHFTI